MILLRSRRSTIALSMLLSLFSLVALPLSLVAEEVILSYHSDIEIAADASMTVTETIRVNSEGQDIRRGIYRDFPTRYTDRLGNKFVVGFEVLGVTRDGSAEPFRLNNRGIGVRVMIGDEDTLLSPGEHSYSIRYKTNRQIGYFEDHDELYWNVTGNGWAFRILTAGATVTLPTTLPTTVSANEITMAGYTGPSGATGQDYTANTTAGGASIQTTQTLGGQSGLTLVMTWPKGILTEPDARQLFGYLLSDNRGLLLSLLTLIAVFVFLYLAWSRVGRDPAAGVIFPHYDPPKGYSPASARYISKMKYDIKAFTAAIINMAVKGHLTIGKEDDDYVLSKTASEKSLAPGEQVLLDKLFGDSTELKLETKNRVILSQATQAHRKALRRDYLNMYFSRNSVLLLPPLLGSVCMLIIIGVTNSFTPIVALVYGVIVLLLCLFAYLLQAPSSKGRLLMDKLEGFKLYLEVAEQDDLNLIHPPDMTPELFERYLPFAIALGVEQHWADRFSQVFASLQSQGGSSYHPAWYLGHFHLMHINDFTKDVSTGFDTAISSATTPPGSSSGTAGMSGGGGGGGGW